MPRDSQQLFYRHTKLVFRWLIVLTVLFVITVIFIGWRNLSSVDEGVVSTRTILHYSDKLPVADVTRQYGSGARYIHDIEQYPEIKARFFEGSSLDFNADAELEEALRVMLSARPNATEGERQHVYATSYYIGNLLVLPEVTLYDQLVNDRPETTVLLEAALADVRAGAVKIGAFYDVAPPFFYEEALANALYYTTPSSPSLTVSEVAIVLYMLAEIDPTRARVYEQQLHIYAEQAFKVGAHFPSDIQSALDLAAVYYQIIATHPEYQTLLTKARTEWSDEIIPMGESTNQLPRKQFFLQNFPYQSEITVDRIINNSYLPNTPQESTVGSLYLTLEDLRIPNAVPRLYRYSWEEETILPIALDLLPRQYPFLLSSIERASYRSAEDYFFITAHEEATKLIKREGEEVRVVSAVNEWGRIIDIDSLPGSTAIAITEQTNNLETRVRLVDTTQDPAVVLRTIENARHPTLIDEADFMYVDAEENVFYAALSADDALVEGLQTTAIPTAAFERSIKYVKENNILLVTDSSVNPSTLVPETAVALYEVDGFRAELRYSVTFVDALLTSGELSPGGRYLALMANTPQGGREPKILLFDIMNGIIKKEIAISDYMPSTARVDAWIIF